MHCPYCRTAYTLEESCFCLPRMSELNLTLPTRIEVPWGDAEPAWSFVPDPKRKETAAKGA